MDRWKDHPVISWIFFGHLWLAFGAVAQRWWMASFGFPVDARGSAATGLAVIAAYGYLRLVRASEPDPIPSSHITWVRQQRAVLMALVVLAGSSALGLSWGQHLVFGPWSLAVPVLVVFYLLPVRNVKGRSMGLRQVPGIKVLLVALGWTFVTCGVSNEVLLPFQRFAVTWHALMQFCFFAALAILFDIGDLRYDPPVLRTVPHLLGARAAKFGALILLLPWATFLTIVGLAKGPDPRYLLPLFGLLVLAIFILLARPHRPWWFFTVMLDGVLVLLPLLAWVGALFA